jgi:16S rRNA processing protein RimM
MEQKKVRVGKIVGCHGIRGDIKLRPSSEDADWAVIGATVFLKNKAGQEQPLTIQNARQQGPVLILHFREFENRTQAEPLVGSTLFATVADLKQPEEGEYWVDDLIGLSVLDAETSRVRGKVKDILSSGGTDFLEIQLEESAETAVIPFNEHFFPVVDI